MTRKHFEAIAEDINKRAVVIMHSEESTDKEKYYGLFTLNHLVYDLGSSFAKFNKNFNYDKFVQACGVQTLLIELG